MKLNLFMYALAFLALLLTACDKAADDVLPSSFAELSLQNDHYLTQAGQPVLLTILANDHITGPANITVGTPANGTLSPGPETGQYLYQPHPGFTGTELFTYTACIEAMCKTADVSVQVSALPCELVANFDADTTNFNTPIAINVLANDFLCDDPSLVVLEAGNATIRDMVTVQDDSTLLFTPPAGFYGVASFSYRISNGTSQDQGMVKVLVRQPITQFCSTLEANHDDYHLYVSTYSPGTVDLKHLALQNDVVCPNYPLTFELLPTNQYYYGYVYPSGAGSQSTYTYVSYYTGYASETFAYQLRQQLPSMELVSAPAYITIYLNY